MLNRRSVGRNPTEAGDPRIDAFARRSVGSLRLARPPTATRRPRASAGGAMSRRVDPEPASAPRAARARARLC